LDCGAIRDGGRCRALAAQRRSKVEVANNFLASADIEDVVTVVDGRRELLDGVLKAVDRSNLFAALRRVKQSAGSPGVDGMTVEELPPPCISL
jgi:hypothetical protein